MAAGTEVGVQASTSGRKENDADPLGALLDVSIVDHGSCVPGMRRYLAYFVHRHLEYRVPEFEAVASTLQDPSCQPVWELPCGNDPTSPLWYVHLPSDTAVQSITKQVLLTKVVLELWGEGSSSEEMLAAVTAYPTEMKAPYASTDQSFKFVIDLFGSSMRAEDQVSLIETLEPATQFKGPIDLVHPMHKFWIVIVQGTENVSGLPEIPARYYFGREVGVSDRSVISKYDLRQRRYLGPTSMEAEMALIMCNMGKVTKHSLVYDPFVGTGSILVAAGHRGALTLGTDIDMRVIKLGKKDSKGRHVNVYTNFADYGLRSPMGLLRADLHRLPFRSERHGFLDAIICDPPYGVRAGGRKGAQRPYTPRDRDTHIAATDPYPLGECLRDLLDTAGRLLRRGGRLVYFLPAIAGFYDAAEIPTHPALHLISNCEQVMSTKYSRRLITMEKGADYDAAAAERHHAIRGPPTMRIDHLHDHVYMSRTGSATRLAAT